MREGGGGLLLVIGLALTGCAAGERPVAIRPISDSRTQLLNHNDTIATARGQLAIGNVGLALEAFRKAQREQPDNVQAAVGVADCYAAMDRFDLAQSNYEAALALHPHDAQLLRSLAGVLTRLGKLDDAAAALADSRAVEAAPIAQGPMPVAGAKPATAAVHEQVATLPALVTSAPQTPPQGAVPNQAAAERTAPALARLVAALLSTATQELHAANPARVSASITDKLPSGTAGELAGPDSGLAERLPAPRLERISTGEVALISIGSPLRRAVPALHPRVATHAQWIPLRGAPAQAGVRIVNAARLQGVAARTRAFLLRKGWRRVTVANAGKSRRATVVFYPADGAVLGRRLAAQFGVRAQVLQGATEVVLLLGRDARALARTRIL